MENLSPETVRLIGSLAQYLAESKPNDTSDRFAGTMRRVTMEVAIRTLRAHGLDAKWMCRELVEPFVGLRDFTGQAFISNTKLQKVLKSLKLSEFNFSIVGDQASSSLFLTRLERLYDNRELVIANDQSAFTVRSTSTLTSFSYDNRTRTLWCSVEACDLAVILNLLYDCGLHNVAQMILEKLGFDRSGGHSLDKRATPKKKKRRQVIVREEPSEGTTEDAVSEGTGENTGDH